MLEKKNVPYVWGLSSLPIELKQDLPEIPCVYFVTQERSCPWKVFYVGQTVNLKFRFAEHHRLIQFLELADSKPDRIFIRWCPVPHRALRTVEKETISYYRPVLNSTTVLRVSKKDTKAAKRYKIESLMLKIQNTELKAENLRLREKSDRTSSAEDDRLTIICG